MTRKLIPLALIALGACQQSRIQDACLRILAAARTSTDTVLALAAKPSENYAACATFRPDTTRPDR